jgi:hypothetical protein
MTLSPDYAPERDRLGANYGPITYVEFTADVTISGTTEGNATLIVTGISFTANGTDAYMVWFYSPQYVAANADFIVPIIYDNGAFLIRMGVIAQSTNNNMANLMVRRFIPTAGDHVIDIRALRGSVNGTVKAGTGAAGQNAPGFVAVSKF